MPGTLMEAIETFADLSTRDPYIFLDYDGTLVPIVMDPEKALPDEHLLDLLTRLSRRYKMFVVTGRSMAEIGNFIGNGFNVIALHGAVSRINGIYREHTHDLKRYVEICNSLYEMSADLKEKFRGLRIYNKGGNLLFHLGLVDIRNRERLIDQIREMASSTGMSLYLGKMIAELRIPGINKGTTIKEVRESHTALIAGDDNTDEDAFEKNPDAMTIKVGGGKTRARFVFSDVREMRSFLERITSLGEL